MRTINLIVLHCTATRVTQDFTVEDLKACHLARGFKSIGYHYYITKDGTLYPCRPEREVGAMPDTTTLTASPSAMRADSMPTANQPTPVPSPRR